MFFDSFVQIYVFLYYCYESSREINESKEKVKIEKKNTNKVTSWYNNLIKFKFIARMIYASIDSIRIIIFIKELTNMKIYLYFFLEV